MKKKVIYILSVLAFVTVFYKVLIGVNNTKPVNSRDYKTFTLNLPDNLNFAGETLPVNNLESREALDKELQNNSFKHAQSILLHKRAAWLFPVIEPILKKYKVPDDFKYIALVESGLSNVVSPAGASGYWQFIEATAIKYGLEISDEVDERNNIEKSTEAACKYFKDAHKIFKSWTLAAASYNLGIGGIQKQMNQQGINNYYDLHLNKETANYIFRILAIKEIISKPKAYGYKFRNKDLYPKVPLSYIEIDTSITNLSDFAQSQKVDYNIFKLLNPWLLGESLGNVNKKKYKFKLPKESMANLTWLLASLPVDTVDTITRANYPIDTVKVILPDTKQDSILF